MPTGTLSGDGKALWEKVYNASKANGDSQEVAARKAWAAVKAAGWHKDAEGNWIKKSDLQEFTLTIRKASFDPVSGEMRWRADTSDVDSDLYDDNMSMELFADFIDRIERSEPPPEPIRDQYTSDYWGGGMPYLSLSHYYDLGGSAVPGIVDAIYVDGKFLKAKGRLYDNQLGKAVWSSLKSDLEHRAKTDHSPVRISIAFLDYMHKHKSTGFVFERDFTDPTKIVCPECRAEHREGRVGGKIFLKGLLIHLALTRVPVNQRTIMEVEKAMTTRLEDAASIVGTDLAAEIDAKSLEVGKAELEEMVITRSDEEPQIVEELAVTKKEGDCSHPSSHYLVVEDSQQPTTWHLRVKNCAGEPDHRLMGAAWAALHGGYRGNKYSGPNKDAAISKLAGMYRREKMDTPTEAKSEVMDTDQLVLDAINALSESLAALTEEVGELKASVKDKKMGEKKDEMDEDMQEHMGDKNEEDEAKKKAEVTAEAPQTHQDIVTALSEAMNPTVQRLDILIAALSQKAIPTGGVPERRSIPASSVPQSVPGSGYQPGQPVKIGDFVKRSIGT